MSPRVQRQRKQMLDLCAGNEDQAAAFEFVNHVLAVKMFIPEKVRLSHLQTDVASFFALVEHTAIRQPAKHMKAGRVVSTIITNLWKTVPDTPGDILPPGVFSP